MKVKILRTFRDKYSKERHKEGEILDISEKRFGEINSTSFGILVEKTEEEAPKEKEPAEPTEDNKPKKDKEKKSTKK